ncbi:hypothetical protein GEV33_001425 [Tenebrio molitor]|uniref:Uncharacterized protein n=1 Tax=Tenebrio molitor TaxID=7067 RepID=A0A8J6HX32_TENMO|nr:hypothetical protein GEV33_001425 [Tenebrio molitor]
MVLFNTLEYAVDTISCGPRTFIAMAVFSFSSKRTVAAAWKMMET